MNVFGVGEVGEKGEDRTECSPVAEDAEGLGVRGGEEVREQSAKGWNESGASAAIFAPVPMARLPTWKRMMADTMRESRVIFFVQDVLVKESARV